jgi:prepilin-type N-terminal cleavage/methylation domain-containing protein
MCNENIDQKEEKMRLRMKKGFTLIELIIVIVIIGMLALVALPRYLSNIQNARRGEAISTMRSIRDALQAEYARNGSYPANIAAPFTLAVNIDGIAGDEINVTTSNTSGSFDYAWALATTCISATAVAARGGGTTSYSMNAASGAVFNTATCS